MKPVKPLVVICDLTKAVSGNDVSHLTGVLKGDGYRVIQVIEKSYDAVVKFNPSFVIADPSFYDHGVKVDDAFANALRKRSRAGVFGLVLCMSGTGYAAGLEGVVDKSEHSTIIRSVESYCRQGRFRE